MLSDEDHALVAAAQAAIRARYRPEWHVVGAALRMRSGEVFTGIHLEATVGRIAVCAEAIAIGRAVTESGSSDIAAIVAVYHPAPSAADQTPAIVAPCGMCRELIVDYAPEARVIVPSDNGGQVVPATSLIPGKFSRPG